jgi:hypothetical protein
MDEIDVIRRMAAEPPDPDVDARQRIAAPLMERIEAAAPRRKRRASRSFTVVLVAAAIAITGGAIAWALSNGSARETVSVQCLIRGNDAIIPAATGDPVADCAANWRRTTGSNPPGLVAYDNGLGGITVMAADEAPLPGATAMPSGATQNVSLVAVQQSLDDYVSGLNSGCYDSATAAGMTQQTLTRFGLTDWTINPPETDVASTPTASPMQGTAERCVSVAVLDPPSQTVQLLGSPGGPPPPDAEYEKLAAKLRTIAQGCMPLDVAKQQVRSAADSLGLSEAGNGYQLTEVREKGATCTSIVENVGGTIFLILRGPTG